MATVLNIITDAMQTCGAIAMNEAPSSSDVQVCLQSLNYMIDLWSAQNILLRASTGVDLTLTANKRVYTIGVGGDFNQAKPLKLDYGFVTFQTNITQQIAIVSMQQYQQFEDKNIATGIPQYIAFYPGATQQATQTGEIFIYPIPDSANNYVLHLDMEMILTEFATSNDIITFEPMYLEPLSYSLAVRIWRKFRGSAPIPEDIVALAAHGLRVLENINSVVPPMGTDIPGAPKGSGYNIISDTFG